eukprot:306045_1
MASIFTFLLLLVQSNALLKDTSTCESNKALIDEINTLKTQMNHLILSTNVLNIEIRSVGWKDMTTRYSKIIINGKDFYSHVPHPRGVGIVDIDMDSLRSNLYPDSSTFRSIQNIDLDKFINTATFDTYGDSTSPERLLSHLFEIKQGNIVLIATSDSANCDLEYCKDYRNLLNDKHIWNYIKNKLGVNLINIDGMVSWDSFVLLGKRARGANIVNHEPWMGCIKKKKSEGPIHVSTQIHVTKS